MKKLSESEVYIRVKSMRSLFIFVIISVNTIWATHTGFTESAISTSADYAISVYAAAAMGGGGGGSNDIGEPPGLPTIP